MKKIKVFYQDFQLNVEHSFGGKRVFKPDYAVEVAKFPMADIEEPTVFQKIEMCDYIYFKLNHVEDPSEYDASAFRKIGHTSMSVGDYIEFPDGDIYFCAPIGFHKLQLAYTRIRK